MPIGARRFRVVTFRVAHTQSSLRLFLFLINQAQPPRLFLYVVGNSGKEHWSINTNYIGFVF